MRTSSSKFISCILLISFWIYGTSFAYSQSNHKSLEYTYISPVPGSHFNNASTTIILKANNEISETHLQIQIKGSSSGNIGISSMLSEDGKTFIIKPDVPFKLGERVDVCIQGDDANIIPTPAPLAFHFYIRNTDYLGVPYIKGNENDLSENLVLSNFPAKQINALHVINDSLPVGFPEIETQIYNNPLPGYNFITPQKHGFHYMIMCDNYSTPVYYRSAFWGAHDFKLQPNGLLTFFSTRDRCFYGMNEKFAVVDTFLCGNGYEMSTDFHDLRIQENGHYFLLAYDPQLVNMDTVVPGGDPDAVVTGLIVQEMDANDNVIFQWRSWDHFEITDAHESINMLAPNIDYVHGNSIEIESDTSLLISCRNMNEITKIDRRTGDIIWRLNGENNEFTFINDTVFFSYQHSIRLMPDSMHISIFDNGLGNAVIPFSSAVEYEIDEQTMTATLIKRIIRSPTILGSFMGHAQRHPNGQTTVGWGHVDSNYTSGFNYTPGITEFNEDDSVALEISIPHTNYRAFKFDWKNSALLVDRDEILYDTIDPGEIHTEQFFIYNNTDSDIHINQILRHGFAFNLEADESFTIESMDSVQLAFTISQDTIGVYEDVYTFCSDTEEDGIHQRIACQVRLSAELISTEFTEEYHSGLLPITVFPNPAQTRLRIEFPAIEMHSALSIVNIYGQQVDEQIIQRGQCFFNTDVSAYPAGIYFINIRSENGKTGICRFIIK